MTVSDLLLAKREGFVSVEHVAIPRLAWEPIGKTSNLNALTILAHSLGKPIDAVGTTTFRPPYTPLPLGQFGQNVGAV